MTASSLYKILNSFTVCDQEARLTINGQEVEGATLEFVDADGDDYLVIAVDLHTAKDEVHAV